MITKIQKLKNFGIFHDFAWSTSIPEFRKYNLIYGWNRSGKTTISRIFSSCEKKSTYDKDKCKQYPVTFDKNGNIENEGDFEITTSDKATIKNTDVATNILPIKVFNQDFIDDNVSFDPSGSCNPIIYVSEEDIESKKRLEQLKVDRLAMVKVYEQFKKDRLSKEETINSFLTGLGREVANILFDKSYNKTKAESKIKSIGVDNFSDKVLSDVDKKRYEVISKSEAGKTLTPFSELRFSLMYEGENINDFQKIFTEIKTLLEKKVISETLERLKNDLDLNNWVKQGFDLHKSKEEEVKCLFCQQPLEKDYLITLSKHFSKDYEELQNSIVNLRDELLRRKLQLLDVKKDDLYPDLKDRYISKLSELNEYINIINAWIDESVKTLQEKYINPLVVVTNPSNPEDFQSNYNKIIWDLNKIIEEHNEKARNHSKEVSTAREKLELNSIANALLGQDYKKMELAVEEASKQENESLTVINKNDSDIAVLEKQTSNIGKAIITINNHLEEFFGRKEIELALDGDNKGYLIKRDGKPANNLSEGEKTAIAFSYFVAKVGEGDFDKAKGIIFIDDPISSFDSNFIYHCFSMINTHFKDVGQLFISTHNFQLFNLIKEWFVNKNKLTEKDNVRLRSEGKVEKVVPCEFYMVENFTETDVRKAKLVTLDKTLLNYKSEYHFLFAKLKEFSEKQNTQYEDFYTIGNMARRFFDIFADFKIPTTGDQKSKMDVLIKNINESSEKISAVDAGKAYKLVNEFSHNSDPTSAIEHKDKAEVKDSVITLINIIKESDPNHYKYLNDA